MLITVSRQFGAGGSEVARRVAAALGWRVVDNELIEAVAARAGLPPERVAEREERCATFVERLARTLAAGSPRSFRRPIRPARCSSSPRPSWSGSPRPWSGRSPPKDGWCSWAGPRPLCWPGSPTPST